MRRTKFSTKKFKKFRLLLDSAFARPEKFIKLRKKANIAHCVHDYGLSFQAEDKDIYQRACLENRFVLTINFKDFRKLVTNGKPGILGIDSGLSNEEIDFEVTEFLSDKDPKDFIGKATKI